MNRALRISVALGGLGLVLIFVFLAGRRSSTRSQLQKYKAELRAQGELLTFQELTTRWPISVSRSPARFNNAVASLRSAPVQPGTFNFRTYVGPGQACTIWRDQRPAGWAAFIAEAGEFDRSLAELREELKDPPPEWGPRTNVFSRPGPDFVTIRTAAQWLGGAALAELPESVEDALLNLEALAAVARMNRLESTLVAQMIRVAVANLGCSVTWEALQAPGWTEPQLERLQQAWQSLDLQEAIELGLVGERAGGSELWRIVRQPDGAQGLWAIMGRSSKRSTTTAAVLESMATDYILVPVYKMTSVDADELFYLKTMQAGLDSVRRLSAYQPWRTARQGLDRGIAQVNQAASTLERFHYWLSLLSIPNFTKAADSAVRAETERRLTILAIALKRYQLRHGAWPSSLDALVPDFAASIPLDPMSGRPLGFRATAGGPFVLYSTGEDGKDDGGDATCAASRNVGLWEGRDAVWPAAAPRKEPAGQVEN
jgi:aryl carrier-like protein